jgi:hypothetical protein
VNRRGLHVPELMFEGHAVCAAPVAATSPTRA